MTGEAANDPDACPRCGEHVEAILAYSIGSGEPGGPMREPDTQSKACPSCGAKLRRSPGEAWREEDS